MSFTSLLNRTCTIQSRTATQSTFGEDENAYTDKHTNVPCRMGTKRGRDIANAGRDRNKTNAYLLSHHSLIVPGSYSVADDDRIVIDDENYDVVVAEKESNLHHWVITLKKIT